MGPRRRGRFGYGCGPKRAAGVRSYANGEGLRVVRSERLGGSRRPKVHDNCEEESGEEEFWGRASLLAGIQAGSGNESGGEGELRTEGEADGRGEEGGWEGGCG